MIVKRGSLKVGDCFKLVPTDTYGYVVQDDTAPQGRSLLQHWYGSRITAAQLCPNSDVTLLEDYRTHPIPTPKAAPAARGNVIRRDQVQLGDCWRYQDATLHAPLHAFFTSFDNLTNKGSQCRPKDFPQKWGLADTVPLQRGDQPIELLEHYSTHPTPTPLGSGAPATRRPAYERDLAAFQAPTKRVISHYPHKCPHCGSPAYQGAMPASPVDCSKNCAGSGARA